MTPAGRRDHEGTSAGARTVRTVLRWLYAAAVVTFFMYWSLFLATLIGWDTRRRARTR